MRINVTPKFEFTETVTVKRGPDFEIRCGHYGYNGKVYVCAVPFGRSRETGQLESRGRGVAVPVGQVQELCESLRIAADAAETE